MLKVINLIKMSEKGVSDEVEVASAALHLILMNSKLASISFSLMQVQLWFQFESIVTKLNTNWF